jgi:imidazole glycerol-phosphate synthase subunit HisF
LNKRIIPVISIIRDDAVVTRCFKNPRYLGDPINATRIFNEKLVDELIIIDIRATRNKSRINFTLLEQIATEAFMPLAYGGGIQTIEDGVKIIGIGFEKIIINSAFFTNPNLITGLVKSLGSQSVVVSLDYKEQFGNPSLIFPKNYKLKLSIFQAIKKCEDLGVGEVILHSVSRDGTRKGYDIKIIEKISNSTYIPIVASGGAKDITDIINLFDRTEASACSAGHMFFHLGKENGVLINYPTEYSEELKK